jgi:hypothetical protein
VVRRAQEGAGALRRPPLPIYAHRSGLRTAQVAPPKGHSEKLLADRVGALSAAPLQSTRAYARYPADHVIHHVRFWTERTTDVHEQRTLHEPFISRLRQAGSFIDRSGGKP